MKVDLAKNQEYLVDLIRMVNNKELNNENKSHFDRSSLKIPVKNVEELKALESNDEHKKILVSLKKNNIIILLNNLTILGSSASQKWQII